MLRTAYLLSVARAPVDGLISKNFGRISGIPRRLCKKSLENSCHEVKGGRQVSGLEPAPVIPRIGPDSYSDPFLPAKTKKIL